jgi:hypothetical protein
LREDSERRLVVFSQLIWWISATHLPLAGRAC